jgi:hypothetical protein
MTSKHYIDAEIHTTGRAHKGGYCSDPYDFYEVDEHTTCTFEIPSKQFIKDHCDSDGEITWSGLEELSKKDRLCSGSGYCGCEVKKSVTKATLKKRRNVKADFLMEDSSNEEVDPPKPVAKKSISKTPRATAPMPFANSFRGRINTTYTSNPSWYNSKN